MQSTTTRLSVSAEDSGVTKLTLTTLQQMWEKAEELLSTHNAITPAPGSDSRAKMVMSYSSSMSKEVPMGSTGVMRSALVGYPLKSVHIPLLLPR